MNKLLPAPFLLLLLSCNSNGSKPAEETVVQPVTQQESSVQPAAAPAIVAGSINPSIALKNFPAESYALYLPKGFDEAGAHGIMLFFDPHGDGTIPLDKYKAWADKYDFILAGSNTSKNGMDLQQGLSVAQHLLTEVETNYKADTGRVMFAGFSGGAVVAITAAISNPLVKEVVYCGQSASLNGLNHSIAFLGVAGLKDMNYSNVIMFDQLLAQIKAAHYLIEWKGKHEWPDASVFENAFVKPASIPKAKLAVVNQSKLDALQKEDADKNELMAALQNKTVEWWKQKISSLNSAAKTDAKADRLLGYVSLACYSISKNLLAQGNANEAERILTIYEMADPGNKDCQAFKAQLNSLKTGH